MIETFQLFSTLFMTGLIWFVQLVHYPLFRLVGESPKYHAAHQKRTTWVVLPVMGVELLTTGWLLILRGTIVDWCGAFLLSLIWLSTVLLQIPCHQKLSNSFSLPVVDRLVRTNWIRTIAWSVRSSLLLFIAH